jgi:hypothetical protein
VGRAAKTWPGHDRYHKSLADPATADREYTDAELEFLRAVDAERCRVRPRFLTTCDYLRILLALGYRKPIDYSRRSD